ncbi:MAG: ABC transporter ATP-binding protein [Gemmataceae bacterium]
MRPLVQVESLSKRYPVGDARFVRYRTLRDLTGWWRTTPPAETAWALRDVSLDVRPGEVVGLVGRNGAGKSTLLKVLARISRPTAGRAVLRGRVGSLLELGTGFHLELTGRENVYLNGAILGLSRRQVARAFDEIVAFAEVEGALDRPVKQYSSGMFMRLAFAVAAHLDAEVLLIDEALAVGDTRFQRRCVAKIREAGAAGRAVLVVSHDLTALARLCTRAVWLDAGRVVRDGPVADVVADYLHSGHGLSPCREWAETAGDVRLVRARVHDAAGATAAIADIARPVFVELEYDVTRPGMVLLPRFTFDTAEGVCAFAALDADPAWVGVPRPAGRYRSRVEVPADLLAEGTLIVGVAVLTAEPHVVRCEARDAVAFQAVDAARGLGVRPSGVVRPRLRWETAYAPERAAA